MIFGVASSITISGARCEYGGSSVVPVTTVRIRVSFVFYTTEAGESVLCPYTHPNRRCDPHATGLYQSLLTTTENWTSFSLFVLSLFPGWSVVAPRARFVFKDREVLAIWVSPSAPRDRVVWWPVNHSKVSQENGIIALSGHVLLPIHSNIAQFMLAILLCVTLQRHDEVQTSLNVLTSTYRWTIHYNSTISIAAKRQIAKIKHPPAFHSALRFQEIWTTTIIIY